MQHLDQDVLAVDRRFVAGVSRSGFAAAPALRGVSQASRRIGRPGLAGRFFGWRHDSLQRKSQLPDRRPRRRQINRHRKLALRSGSRTAGRRGSPLAHRNFAAGAAHGNADLTAGALAFSFALLLSHRAYVSRSAGGPRRRGQRAAHSSQRDFVRCRNFRPARDCGDHERSGEAVSASAPFPRCRGSRIGSEKARAAPRA